MNGNMLSLILLASFVFLYILYAFIESVMSSGKVRDGLT